MQLCKHEPHKLIQDILSPKWSNDTVRINIDKISPTIEHYLLQFVDASPRKKYGWFYLSGKVIRSHKIIPNGRGQVYEVPMSARETFEPIKERCGHHD